MPLFGKSNDKGINFKARLEHKLYLARENPDAVFDIADCDLKTVPSGVYSLCKVFRKETLYLQNNNLTSLSGGGALQDLYLLQILDIRCNNLTTLPDDIRYLGSLKELYLNNNYLKLLPESITELSNLKVLSCSFNKLKKLPRSIGNMKNLERVYLQGNPAMCVLPDSLCFANRIKELVLDVGRYTHPPDHIVLQGTFSVMNYLANELGVEYTRPSDTSTSTSDFIPHEKQLKLLDQRDRDIQEHVSRYEQKKEERLQERLSVEKEISAQKEKEFQLQTEMKLGKDKLMEDLRKQEFKMAEEVQKFQQQKDIDRNRLIEQLQSVEESADQLINQMLAANNTLREPSRVLKQQELDHIALEKLFSEQSLDLRRKEVISAMESLLAEERLQKEKLLEYELAKAEVVKNSLSRELEWSEEVDALLSCRSSHQSALVDSIAAEERDQVVAVATLLERNDLESVRLRAQLHMVEKQLAALTALELQKNNLNLTQLQCDVSEKRTALSELLVDILNQQQERKKHHLQTLIRMEHNRWDADETGDYWLKQYQKLLDLMPQGFTQGFETKLVHQMVIFGVVHCLPFLSQCNLNNICEDDLINAGMTKEEERVCVLKAVSAYLQDAGYHPAYFEPNAPPAEEDFEPSAPEPPPTECVVCLNNQCGVVFVPCGHLCCCRNCSDKLSDCPLCRVPLERKIRVISV